MNPAVARRIRSEVRLEALQRAVAERRLPAAGTGRSGHDLRPQVRADLIVEIGPSTAILRANVGLHVKRVTGMEPGSAQELSRGDALDFVAHFSALDYPLADLSVEFLAENPKVPVAADR